MLINLHRQNMMVQSCQQRSAGQMGLAYRDIDDGNIILRRPHTVLLLSTVADGMRQVVMIALQ